MTGIEPMDRGDARTLVCSVLFLDIAGYSTLDVGEQLERKQKFNAALLSALEPLEGDERVVMDTGDGAAIAVPGDPEKALFVAVTMFDNIGDLEVRGGVNLGPVSLMKDINGHSNVIGDGINVAQRIMGFADAGELLVSRSFFDVARLLASEYASIFQPLGARADKHGRTHEVFGVVPGVRVGRRIAEARARAAKAPAPQDGIPVPPAQISDAGPHLIVSGYSEAAVRAALDRLAQQGRHASGPVTCIGSKWFASVPNPKRAVEATVQEFGFTTVVSGPTRESVEARLKELLEYGARLVQPVELVDGAWTAVCDRS
jgi:class 3 adenylate cyclase